MTAEQRIRTVVVDMVFVRGVKAARVGHESGREGLRSDARTLFENLHLAGRTIGLSSEDLSEEEISTLLKIHGLDHFVSPEYLLPADSVHPSNKFTICEALGNRCAIISQRSSPRIRRALDAGLNVVVVGKVSDSMQLSHRCDAAIASIDSLDLVEETLNAIERTNDFVVTATQLFHQQKYQEAAVHFRIAAQASLDLKDHVKASALFAREAIAQERSEVWRSTSLAWYQAAACLKASATSEANSLCHTEYDQTEHHYPTVTFAEWDSMPLREQQAKAYRYAGYHAQNTSSPQDSYLFYLQSAKLLNDSGMHDKAAEVLVDACLSFIKEYGDLSQEYLGTLLQTITRLPLCTRELDPGLLYLQQVVQALRIKGNSERAESLIVAAFDRERKLLLLKRRYPGWFLYTLWRQTSLYGTSLGRWTLWTIALVVFVFPIAIAASNGSVSLQSWRSDLYWSILAFTTNGLPDFPTTTRLCKVVLCTEVASGYLFLGILATLILRKVTR